MATSSITVRPAEAADAPDLARLRATALPHLVGTPAGLRARLHDRETAACWLALVAGDPAGYVIVRRPVEDGHARVTLVVSPDHQRLGVGSRLLELAEARVCSDGGRTATSVADGPDGRAFALARGYAFGRAHRFSGVRLADVPSPPSTEDDVELRSLDVVDPRAIWALHHETAPDDPSGMSISQPYETWYEEDWAFPDHAPGLGMAAIVDGAPVAFTHVFADRARGALWSAMTGVRAAHRGRGLARLVKAASLQAARREGFTDAYTANDAGNRPMLAVNDWLGYRPVAEAWSVHRRLG